MSRKLLKHILELKAIEEQNKLCPFSGVSKLNMLNDRSEMANSFFFKSRGALFNPVCKGNLLYK